MMTLTCEPQECSDSTSLQTLAPPVPQATEKSPNVVTETGEKRSLSHVGPVLDTGGHDLLLS